MVQVTYYDYDVYKSEAYTVTQFCTWHISRIFQVVVSKLEVTKKFGYSWQLGSCAGPWFQSHEKQNFK